MNDDDEVGQDGIIFNVITETLAKSDDVVIIDKSLLCVTEEKPF